MPATINPIRKAKVKRALLAGKSAIQAQLDAGYRPATAHNSTNSANIKQCMKEITKELDKRDYIGDAYRTLHNCLRAPKKSDRIAASQVLLRFKVGDKSQVKSTIEVSEGEKIELGKYRNALLPIRSDN